MDHSDVREILEDAAIEPGGLERLMAGDTGPAAIVAGHLAGCPDCAEELERLRRSVGLIVPTVRAVPPPDLRERTLAYVAAIGRPRAVASSAAVRALDPGAAADREPWPMMPHVPELAAARARRAGRARIGWLAGLAAALIVAVSGTALYLNASHDATTQGLAAEVQDLAKATTWSIRIDAQPDARRVQLASATGGGTTGTIVYSPSSKELVVVSDGLTPPPAGREYRCWVEVDGARTPIGKMFFGGGLAYWVGKVDAVAGLAPTARFGVNLVDLGGADAPGQPVLVSAS